MMKSLLETKVQYAFKVLSEFLDIDIPALLQKDKNEPHKTNLWKYGKEKTMYEIYCLINMNSLDAAYQKCVDLIYETLDDVRVKKHTNANELDALGRDFIKLARVISEFDEYFSEESKTLKKYLFSNEWLLENEKTDDLAKHFNWNWINDAKNAISKEFVKTYVISGNPKLFSEAKSYSVADAIVITDSAIPLKGKPIDDDQIHVSVFMKIEEIIDYSFFIIRFQYKDACIIATDKMKFVNPRVATCSRNPSRRREEYYENVDLPYYIIDDIIKWRKESKELTQFKGTETYIKPLREYLKPCAKVCLRLLIETLIADLEFTQSTELIGYATDTIKMIGTSETSPETSCFAKTNYNECLAFQQELVLPKTTALVKSSPTELLEKFGSPTSLLTQTEAENLYEWLQHETIREQKQSQLDEYSKDNFTPDIKRLQRMFHENFKDIAEILFSGDEVYSYIIDAPLYVNRFGAGQYIPQIKQLCSGNTSASEGIPSAVVHAFTSDEHSYFDYFYCINHQDCKARHKMILHVSTWKELVCLLNIKREYLPFTYQNYNSHTWHPYYGNPLLANVNPEFLVMDYMSRTYQNGYSIAFYLCKNCVNHYYKEHKKFKRSLVLMSYLNKCIVDIVDYDKFIEENQHIFPEKMYHQVF